MNVTRPSSWPPSFGSVRAMYAFSIAIVAASAAGHEAVVGALDRLGGHLRAVHVELRSLPLDRDHLVEVPMAHHGPVRGPRLDRGRVPLVVVHPAGHPGAR